MQTNVFAVFSTAKSAEKAAGALLDIGVRNEDLTVIQGPDDSVVANKYEVVGEGLPSTNEDGTDREPVVYERNDNPATAEEVEHDAKAGLSTTTAGDAGIGAVKGASWGLGIGALAALTALFIPGVGLVIGGGALAAAIGAAAATTGAGAVAGAVTGYLVEQGFEEKEARQYEEIVSGGGAVISVSLPSNNVEEPEFWEIVDKYDGQPFGQLAENKTAYVI